MKIEDVFVGQKVRICGRFLLTQLNSVATVLQVLPTPEWSAVKDFPYPNGMVQVQLADNVDWPCRDPWIGPEDLTDVEWAVKQ